MRLSLLSIALVALAVLAAPAAGESRRTCGTIAGGVALYDVRAKGVSCKAARKTARAWRRTLFKDECDDGRFLCHVRGYTCRAKPPAEVNYPVRCKKADKRVRWWIHAD